MLAQLGHFSYGNSAPSGFYLPACGEGELDLVCPSSRDGMQKKEANGNPQCTPHLIRWPKHANLQPQNEGPGKCVYSTLGKKIESAVVWTSLLES